ncbi:MAG: hypothetical protein IJ265_04240, partial [Oscillospiraceae bacterium]|nr:hypothetical protein [Oscillospiraceae bacterium]
MRSKFKRFTALLAAAAMCGSMTLHFPNDAFTIGASAAEGDLCPKCSGTFDANGFCTEDGSHYEPAADTDNNGVYEIGNAGQLYWFMEHINEGGEQADTDAVLTANIIVNENVLNEDGTLNGDGSGFREWFPIGFCYDLNEDGHEDNVSYTGTFDGQGHTISGLYFNNPEQKRVGLFGSVSHSSLEGISNVGVIDSYFNAGEYVGGVCGYHCGVITNSYHIGSVNGTNYVGGICGSGRGGLIANCYHIGSVSGSGEAVGGLYGGCSKDVLANCYYDSTAYSGNATGEDPGIACNVSGMTPAQFNSGEAAYLLSQGITFAVGSNEFTFSGDIWGQELGTDTSPALNGRTVYYHYADCEATVKTYNNNRNSDTAGHSYVNGECRFCGDVLSCLHYYDNNGFCKVCDKYQPAEDADHDGCYEIGNAGQLYWFMELVNGSDQYIVDTDAVLTADITMNENVLNADGTLAEGDFRAWFPIGYCYDRDGDGSDENVYYSGAFDGQGHTISGLYFDNAEQDCVGLFGQTEENVKICNVNVADSYFNAGEYVGGVCGWNDDGIITDCTNSGNVTGTDNVGGVCGYNNDGTITNCTNSGSVSGSSYVGGVCGYNCNSTITNCTNSGSVKGAKYVGGVCGRNSAKIITNSTNSGSVTGGDSVGGVCGYNFGGKITNSTNSGNMNGSGCVGGVCGEKYGTITNCYYDSTVFTGDAVGKDAFGTTTDVLGKTTAEFKSGEVAYLLQSAQTEMDEEGNILHVWGQTIGEDTYPVLGGDKVYQCESECSGTFYSNTEGDVQAHAYVNGFCTNADCETPYQPATDTDENGVYEIANGGQLYWFMKLVNNYGETYVDIDAILTADITVNENVLKADGTLNGDGSNFREWFPIGYHYDLNQDGMAESNFYNGTFDGQGHTISGLYFDNEKQHSVGLFGQTSSNAKIQNVAVADSYIKAYNDVGGVCGSNHGSMITNCMNSGTVTAAGTYAYVGGVCGLLYNGKVVNCMSSGNVEDADYAGGVCGKNDGGTITNCYYDSTVFTGDAVGKAASGTTTDVLGKTTAEFKSGEVAYLLQSAQTETDENGNLLHVWGQTIGEDTYPVLGGDKVYQCESECGGTFYSNTENETKS